MRKVYDFFGSYGLACVLLLLLLVLTFLGTIEQTQHGLYEVQKKYFESIFLVHWVGWLPIPLPGVYLVLILLAMNLVVGGIVRMRKSSSTIGVLVIHLGILLMLMAGFVKLKFSSDGNLLLYEKTNKGGFPFASDEYQSYYEWEVAIWDAQRASDVKELLIPEEEFSDLSGAKTRTFESKDLPFKLELSHYERNSRVLPKGPMWQAVGPTVDGFAMKEMPLAKEAEQNIAGVYAKVDGKDNILFGLARYPLVVESGGKKWAIALRKKRFKMPFTVTLDRFTHELYPNTMIAKVYASDVSVNDGKTERGVKIEMNQPLREQGLVLFQASWGPEDAKEGEDLYSVFAVVENPSDQWPLIACIVIAIGMVIAFGQKLVRYIRVQAAERKA